MSIPADSFPPFDSNKVKALASAAVIQEAIDVAEAALGPTCKYTGKHVCKYCKLGMEINDGQLLVELPSE